VAGGPECIKATAKQAREEKDAAKVAAPVDTSKRVGKALPLAYKAIAILQTIPPKDIDRKEALATVIRWCKHNS
jgi:hypothetical protein